MGILGTPIAYDPAGVVSKSAASLLAMTAFDTTNARITFTAKSTAVLVSIRAPMAGATASSGVFLGVLDGSTVKARAVPSATNFGHTTDIVMMEVLIPVTGLTIGNSYTWDAAYGVDIATAGNNFLYGGPDDATGQDAYGALIFEIFDAPNLLAAAVYDPAVAVTKAAATLRALAALDTTNLRCHIAPTSAINIEWRIRLAYGAAGTAPATLFGILEGGSKVARCAPTAANATGTGSNEKAVFEARGNLVGISGAHDYDAATAIQTASGAGGAFKYGGPDDTTTNNAWGAAIFELWQV